MASGLAAVGAGAESGPAGRGGRVRVLRLADQGGAQQNHRAQASGDVEDGHGQESAALGPEDTASAPGPAVEPDDHLAEVRTVNADADLAVLLDCSGSLHEAAVGGGNGGELALGLGVAPLLVGAEALGEYNEEDLRTEYDEAAATALDLGSVQEDTYTISEGGVYVLTGSYAGQLIVEAGKEEVVRLVFEGVSIASALGPAVYIQQAEKVVITLAEGTQNALSGGPEDASDEENANAALYSKEDLSINGAGSLRVAAAETHGIASNDDLILAGGAIDIEADRDGIKGRDSVRIYSGEIAIRSGEDGIVSDNDEGADKGYIVVDGGALNITAANDGMQAETALQINGGDIQIASGGGSAGAATASGAGMQARGGFPGQEAVESEQDVESAKGIKAGSAIEINAGTLGVDSKDDAIHSNGSVAILAGTFSISSGDDAIHADVPIRLDRTTDAGVGPDDVVDLARNQRDFATSEQG